MAIANDYYCSNSLFDGKHQQAHSPIRHSGIEAIAENQLTEYYFSTFAKIFLKSLIDESYFKLVGINKTDITLAQAYHYIM
jgi:hypothetical protein